ncbi:MAG: type II toxin-antitoxin system VapC family toxin [Actinomycetota bacterium]
MIVLDASALTDWLLRIEGRGAAVGEQMRAARVLHTLDFAALEVVSALRRKTARRELSTRRAQQALGDLAATPLRRHRAAPLAARVWELRASHTAYDAAYVALAESLSAPLITTDRPLALSRGHSARIVEPGPSERGTP